jgi:hypothetical protein
MKTTHVSAHTRNQEISNADLKHAETQTKWGELKWEYMGDGSSRLVTQNLINGKKYSIQSVSLDNGKTYRVRVVRETPGKDGSEFIFTKQAKGLPAIQKIINKYVKDHPEGDDSPDENKAMTMRTTHISAHTRGANFKDVASRKDETTYALLLKKEVQSKIAEHIKQIPAFKETEFDIDPSEDDYDYLYYGAIPYKDKIIVYEEYMSPMDTSTSYFIYDPKNNKFREATEREDEFWRDKDEEDAFRDRKDCVDIISKTKDGVQE